MLVQHISPFICVGAGQIESLLGGYKNQRFSPSKVATRDTK
jgi:hypothetical protein